MSLGFYTLSDVCPWKIFMQLIIFVYIDANYHEQVLLRHYWTRFITTYTIAKENVGGKYDSFTPLNY